MLNGRDINKQQTGFTIVELLIVIVVIAILAAITIVAYNGIQQRANNTARVTAAQQAVKLIKAYYSYNDSYPYMGTTCLTLECTNYAGVSEATSNASLLAAIKTIGNPPTAVKAAGIYNGIWYNIRASGATYDGDGSRPVLLLMYWLEGQSQNCGAADVAIQGPGEAWERSPNKYSYNYTNPLVTACWVRV